MFSGHIDYLRLFDWVWQTSAKVSILIVLLLLVKLVFKNKICARLHYLLWSIVIFSLLFPWAPQSSFSLYNLSNLKMQRTNSFSESTEVFSHTVAENDRVFPEETSYPLDQTALAQNSNILVNDDKSPNSITTSPFIHKLFFYLWLIGIIVFVAVIGLVNRRFNHSVQGQSVSDVKLLTALTTAKEKLNIKVKVPLVQTGLIISPSLYGVFRPCVLIPMDILEEFNQEQLNYVFVHELLHLKRKDMVVNWLTLGLLIIHWFNPILWYAFYKFREDQEIACDAITLEHIGSDYAKEYGYTLIKLAENSMRPPRMVSLASLSGSGSQIRRRIRMIKDFRKVPIRWTVLVVGVVVALSFITMTNATATSADTPEVTLSPSPVVSVNSLEPIKLNLDLVKYARENYQGGYDYSTENDIASITYGWMLGGLDRASDKEGLEEKKKQAGEYLPTEPIFVKSYDGTFLEDYYIVPYIQGQKFVGASVVCPDVGVNRRVQMYDGVIFSPREKLLKIDANDAIEILKQEKGIEKPPAPRLVFHSALSESSLFPSDYSLLPSYNEPNLFPSYSILQPSWEFIIDDDTRLYVNQAGKVFNDTNIVPWYETYIAPKYNSQAVRIESNKLIRDDGWSLNVSKVSPLSNSKGGWSLTPYDESKPYKYYAVFLTLENANGKDKGFIPKGKISGVIGSSGKLYDAQELSFDTWYIRDLRGSQMMAQKDGRTIEPGIFKAGLAPIQVDPSEQKLTQIIYQDEYGNQFEIPIQIPESNL
ncbi:M56 family metallopeptidase [Desulfitobacterium sp.]|uniref:M56 family metallopeptidase n=1 Tax=Desulfitobacterium sp. TaxID=49981 RepID=UPI002B21E583|nr:M56 family metallopeptidase [Desulfitobacterium sp.]MEA4902575.1 M56 family metallopeptidase [Desulfitobacterium sp.]